MTEPRSVPAIAVRMEDCPKSPPRRMGDTLFEDALGLFTLKEKDHIETGSAIGEWILVDHTPIFFQPRDRLVEKSYLE